MNPELPIWLLYANMDEFSQNREFAHLMQQAAEKRGLCLRTVIASQLTYGMNRSGLPFCSTVGGKLPQAVISRQRNTVLSRLLEQMGIPVFNGSTVCEICNHKQKTHLFLQGLPMADTVFLPRDSDALMPMMPPVIVKPAGGHGGESVTVCHNDTEYDRALLISDRDDVLVQRVVGGAGRDLRLYVVCGEIVAGVMRTARSGVISNFKRGGDVAAHTPTAEERALGELVIRRFADAGAPLMYAGVDLLYEKDGSPLIGEVEDVVGSRMLYATSNIDIADLVMERFSHIM